ncbi:MAG TPA: NTP transferase domain-containing protein [Vicinamibacterales bacterium]|jgi:spore coat polysaccharide biosynthesis protein SpsF
MTSDTAIVLQARMGSERLPGKALRRLAGETVVGHCLRRLMHAGVAPVVLATTIDEEDDVLAQEGERLGAQVVRGARVDVLRRFVQVIRETGATYIVRATGDNPAVDLNAASRVLSALRTGSADYCCERELPHGAAVEAVRSDVLLDASAHATEADDREHVTTYVKFNRSRYRVLLPRAPAALRRPDVRVTIDTVADLAYMERVLASVRRPLPTADGRGPESHGPAPLAEIIRAADALTAQARVA